MFYLGIHSLLISQVCFAVDVGVTWTQNMLHKMQVLGYRRSTDSC